MKTQNSQTKQTARLARKIRKLRERKKGGPVPWKDVCRLLNILKEQGGPDTGMAYKIAYEEYEPNGRDVRKRFGLRDICTRCRRPFRILTARPARAKSPERVWWEKMKAGEREKLIKWAYRNYLNWKKAQGG